MNVIIEQSQKHALDINILKAHLRIEHPHEDEYLKSIIDMATEILETSIEKPILKKKYQCIHYCNEFTSTVRIPIPVREVREILSVRKLQRCPKRQPEDVKFSIETNHDTTILVTNWVAHPLEIRYSAGMTGNPDKIPKTIQFAILQIAKNIYECSDENVLESKYIKHIIDANRALIIN
ncbi:MAG: head-tail connector protein [Holosporales bacterium]|jgi:uncharacterized phiE125 gp8 family phage protein|nr:head-tail connector protein [Holosporales bacterium]